MSTGGVSSSNVSAGSVACSTASIKIGVDSWVSSIGNAAGVWSSYSLSCAIVGAGMANSSDVSSGVGASMSTSSGVGCGSVGSGGLVWSDRVLNLVDD